MFDHHFYLIDIQVFEFKKFREVQFLISQSIWQSWSVSVEFLEF